MRPSIRFSVFQRDQFTCRYCGRRTPDVVLEVDHVLATSRGGTDDLDNLVTSCADCNRGKAGRPIDEAPPPLDVEARTAQIAEHEQQIAAYAHWRAAQRQREDEEIQLLDAAFAAIPGTSYRPDDEDMARWFWDVASVRQFLRRLGYHEVLEAIEITSSIDWTSRPWASGRDNARDAWRYFCGVCWRRIRGDVR